MAAIAAGVVILWLAEFAGFVVGGLPAGGLGLPGAGDRLGRPAFVGIGALASQLAPRRRIALEIGSGAVGRVAAAPRNR